MTKNIAILILILLLILTGFLFLLRENINYDEKLRLAESYQISQIRYLENVSLLSSNYNELEEKYNKLNEDYQNLKQKEQWQEFEITAYTSNECGTITYCGFELDKNYSKYLNVCAVDPEEIKLGSVVLVKFENGEIKPYMALDTGYAIKGKRIDLYMTDVNEAINFGRQFLQICIIQNK